MSSSSSSVSLGKQQLNRILQYYLTSEDGVSQSLLYEVEAKFGTRGYKRLTKMDYDNVVRQLKSSGLTPEIEDGTTTLKIQLEFVSKQGQRVMAKDADRFRVEVSGLQSIQDYCRTDSLASLVNNGSSMARLVSILQKTDVMEEQKQKDGIQDKDRSEATIAPSAIAPAAIAPAEFSDFNFRVTLKKEMRMSKSSSQSQDMIDPTHWNNTLKTFRYLNRVSFYSANRAFRFDLSIVKSSKTVARVNRAGKPWKEMVKTYTVGESHVFDLSTPEEYEIEIELQPYARILYRDRVNDLARDFQQQIKLVLCGLQRTNYPVSYVEQHEVIMSYHRMIYASDYKSVKEYEQAIVDKRHVNTSEFIGPSLVTLALENIAPINPNIVVPSIVEPFAYSVTEKADGIRHLMYVNNEGRIYLINMGMQVIFTGAITLETRCFQSLIDGELILHNKHHDFINKFAAFDMYYGRGIDIRHRPFMPVPIQPITSAENTPRLTVLQEYMQILRATSITPGSSSPMQFVCKSFYPLFDAPLTTVIKDSSSHNKKDKKKGAKEGKEEGKEEEEVIIAPSIFEASGELLSRIRDAHTNPEYNYEVDGLIFTPTLLGVGSNEEGKAGPKKKQAWSYCFKWKPSTQTITFPKSYNTIDFLVQTQKGKDGRELVLPLFETGFNACQAHQITQYKRLSLCVGFDESQHGYIDPKKTLLDGSITLNKEKEVDKSLSDKSLKHVYQAMQFLPSDPYDVDAGLLHMILSMDKTGAYQMMTEEGQVFHDGMVVEFRYDMSKPRLFRWVPMRVRYDKTAEVRLGTSIGANDYRTANNNWKSIFYPVTEHMISTGQDIPAIELDVYYNNNGDRHLSATQALRDFHNLYVKKVLIQGVSRAGDTLIDLACGKAGDLPKWIAARLSFVLGIDLSKDNIENRINGACARYLNAAKITEHMPSAIFLNGNSALNIRNGQAMTSEKDKDIIRVLFSGQHGDNGLGPVVNKQAGRFDQGFHVSSCQFAIHYMFKNKQTFYSFIRNVCECTKPNGYFIATCYDGTKIFDKLKPLNQGETEAIYQNQKKLWSVTKEYDLNSFRPDESCLGRKITVYQESINQPLDEYLVQFDFLIHTMKKYGFHVIGDKEANAMRLPSGTGNFYELFQQMQKELSPSSFGSASSMPYGSASMPYGSASSSPYKSAMQMTNNEQTISFFNRYIVFQKNTSSTINVEQLTEQLINQNQIQDNVDVEMELAATTAVAQEAAQEAAQVAAQEAAQVVERKRKEAALERKRKRKEIATTVASTAATEEATEETTTVAKKPKTNKPNKKRVLNSTDFQEPPPV